MRAILRLTTLAILAFAAAAQARSSDPWVPTWSAANYGLEKEASPSQAELADATLRQTVRLSIAADRIRIVVTNAEGGEPLAIGAASVALAGPPGTSAIAPATDRAVAFGGRRAVVVPAGGSVTSDVIDLPLSPLARLAVSLHLTSAPVQPTGHLRSLSTSWLARGNQTVANSLAGAKPLPHWYFLSAVEAEAPDAKVIIALGDSITDGSLSAMDANERWPDRLAERLVAGGQTGWAVANKGIAGNRLLAPGRGPSALARFEADALSVPHAKTIVLLEGINDLGQFAKTSQDRDDHLDFRARMIAGYEDLISRAHVRGLRVVGATMMPFAGSDYAPTPLDEEDRQAINRWIRSSGRFDAVIDWDAAMRDPADPARLAPADDSGDHLHPSSAGYRTMAEAIVLSALTR